MIKLKHVESDKNGNNYITIRGKIYYEHIGNGEPKNNSFYISKANALFIGDKTEGINVSNGVSFRCSSSSPDYINFDQREAKYIGGVIRFLKTYKSETFSTSAILTTIRKNGKIIKVTKNMVDIYLSGKGNKTLDGIIITAMKLDPEFFAYMESISEANNKDS